MKERILVVVGASGHGRVIREAAASLKYYSQIVFLDDDEKLQKTGVVSGGKEYVLQYKEKAEVIIGIGNAHIRRKLIEYYNEHEIEVTSLIHPFSWVSQETEIGEGTVIMASAVVQPGCTLGKGVIVNTSSSIDHDCKIGDYSHISVGSHIAGSVYIGNNTWVGAGATVSNNITICDDVTIGAGAVVVKNITEPGTYVGVPARKIN